MHQFVQVIADGRLQQRTLLLHVMDMLQTLLLTCKVEWGKSSDGQTCIADEGIGKDFNHDAWI
ncbi:hypothetical protein KUH03_31190 [Sphingobacterium sp. E70]|uniref:hypothetical protein n=1 Tax=Sphingobacterium sp. E70 TaxID=2853439 RepID=UPI00211CB847|nr:hypothetical protein [Sphingobacterium sp. E70]ULT23601.1 hypothetical protein KUH03_31190 [Sphingobacterium sp. E70]